MRVSDKIDTCFTFFFLFFVLSLFTYICDASNDFIVPFYAVCGSSVLVLVTLQAKYTWQADQTEEKNAIGHPFRDLKTRPICGKVMILILD